MYEWIERCCQFALRVFTERSGSKKGILFTFFRVKAVKMYMNVVIVEAKEKK